MCSNLSVDLNCLKCLKSGFNQLNNFGMTLLIFLIEIFFFLFDFEGWTFPKNEEGIKTTQRSNKIPLSRQLRSGIYYFP